MTSSTQVYEKKILFSSLSTSTTQLTDNKTLSNGKIFANERNSPQKGTFKWPSGACYEGEFYNGQRNGHGIQTWQDNSMYDGEFLNDMRHGYGRHQWSSGEVNDYFFKINALICFLFIGIKAPNSKTIMFKNS